MIQKIRIGHLTGNQNRLNCRNRLNRMNWSELANRIGNSNFFDKSLFCTKKLIWFSDFSQLILLDSGSIMTHENHGTICVYYMYGPKP